MEYMYRKILPLVFLSLVLIGCAATRPPDETQWNDPGRVFTVLLRSMPDSATVFGMAGGTPGSRVGTTPLVITYTATADGTLWCRNCGNVSPMETLILQRTSKILEEACTATFRALLLRDGYKPYNIEQLLHQEYAAVFSSGKNCWDDLVGRRVEFTAVLERVTAVAQPQQQQQQQQQTVVIPGTESPRGTVIVTCNVEKAEVYIDGLFVGNAPSTLKLADGIHIVEVKHSGYVSYRREIRVLTGAELSLQAELVRP